MSVESSLIEEIRAASRTMVRELGFMRTTLASTDYSPSAVHALLEIAARGTMTAAQLGPELALEKSSVSRMVGKLIKAGELRETADDDDGRAKKLSLTAQGERTVADIHAYGRKQVATALETLNPMQQQAVAHGLAAYAQALQARRLGSAASADESIAITSGYQPGVVGRVAEMHAIYYSRRVGFGSIFERQVASGMAEFVSRLENGRNGLWVAMRNGRIVGSVAIDGEDLGGGNAHLRWFIMDDGCRGQGVGRRLLEEATAFCDRCGFSATHLWTFKGLDAARRLYQAFGFELAQEALGDQWGASVTEQQFIRPNSAAPPRNDDKRLRPIRRKVDL